MFLEKPSMSSTTERRFSMKPRVSVDDEDRFLEKPRGVVVLEAMFSMDVVVDSKRASTVGAPDVRRRAAERVAPRS